MKVTVKLFALLGTYLPPGAADNQAAGEVADGLIVHPFNSLPFLEERALPAVRRGLDKAGRSIDDFLLQVNAIVITGESEEEYRAAENSVKGLLGFYASTPAYRGVMEVHGWGTVADQLRQLSFESRWDDMPLLVSEEMVGVFCVAGSRREIAAKLRARYADHATRITIPMPQDSGAGDAWLRGLIQELHGADVPSAA